MNYNHIVPGSFVSRPNRFIAKVQIDGRLETCHVKNTGRCRELLVPQARLVLEYHPDAASAGRKTSYDVIGVYKEHAGSRDETILINMDSQAPNAAAWEWVCSGGLERYLSAGSLQPALPRNPENAGSGIDDETGADADTGSDTDTETDSGIDAETGSDTDTETGSETDTETGSETIAGAKTDCASVTRITQIRREVAYENSRFDLSFLLNDRQAFMEVKGVTLEQGGIAAFPDAPTERGVKHLDELASASQKGIPCFLLLVIQMKGITGFRPNMETHPEFGRALARAREAGVTLLAFDCLVTESSMTIDRPIPIDLTEAYR